MRKDEIFSPVKYPC